MPIQSPLSRLGAILKLLREEKGQNLADLAAQSGVSLSMLREIEETTGVAPMHLSHLDQILSGCRVSLADLAEGEKKLLAGDKSLPDIHLREVDTLLRTIESLQERVESLEFQLNDRHSATMRAFQMQSIKLLEKTMESSGMSREEMRRLMSDMRVEDVS